MNLTPLDISPDEAKARLAEYETALRRERNAEDEAIAMGYRAAARGLPVVSLPDVMSVAGWFDTGLPRLAIARADAIECWVDVHTTTGQGRWRLSFSDSRWPRSRGALVGAHTVSVTVPAPRAWTNRQWGATTLVPLVPPQHRPRRPRLGRFHVLWEVDTWTLAPARDPALLRHIRGDLWAVVATWELTDLERAVLAQRARS